MSAIPDIYLRPAPNGSNLHLVHFAHIKLWNDEIERLRGLLVEANDAFDECTGDYPKELCDGEPWREFRTAQPTTTTTSTEENPQP